MNQCFIMNLFKELKVKFDKKKLFREITTQMMSKEIINLSKSIIEELDCDQYINERELLSIFLLNKFPKDTLGDLTIEANQKVRECVKKIIETEFNDNESLKSKLVQFSFMFKTWKEEDVLILKNQLFNEYHQLTVDVMNCGEDSEKATVFLETQKRIIECAKQIGGEDFITEIQSYSPIILNKETLEEQYNKACNDLLIDEFNQKKYDVILKNLHFVKSILKTLKPLEGVVLEEKIDIPYIEHKLQFDQFTNKKAVDLFMYILDFIKKIQSPARDEELNSIQLELEVKEVCIPSMIIKVKKLLDYLLIDLQEFQSSHRPS